MQPSKTFVRLAPPTCRWKRWIAQSKMLGVNDDRVIQILRDNGIDENTAMDEIATMERHPYYEAGEFVAHKLRKLRSLLNAQAQLSRLSSTSRDLRRRGEVSRKEFLETYYAANRPVVLTNLMQQWKAIELWDPQYLTAKCGAEIVEVMTGRASDPLYEVHSDSHKKMMLFSDYVDIVVRSGGSNDSYMVANNRFMERPGTRVLLDDIQIFDEYLDRDKISGRVFFWFGPA